jgi:hypothetical protein
MKDSKFLALVLVVFLATLVACSNEARDDYACESIAEYIYDLDYLLNALENNLALFDVAYWARGIDIHALIENARQEVLSYSEMDNYLFKDILQENMRPLWGFAHFAIEPPPIYVGSGAIVTTDILDEGRVAYLAMRALVMPDGESSIVEGYDAAVLDFFEEIRDFEHLIVDLRGTPGGWPHDFLHMVVAPNIAETLAYDGFVFLIYGSRQLSLARLDMSNASYISPERAVPIRDILAANYLPDFNLNDIYRLDYGFRVQTAVAPRLLTRFDYQPAFGGKIWVLTDGEIFSAAEISSRFMKNTGFATLVGDITGGAYGGPQRPSRTLPNSGITFRFDVFYVTDSRGRPLEAGTIPHHFNHPGMDALETTLALIAEGDY